MNKQKIYMTALVSALLAVIVYVSYGMLNAGKEEIYYGVSVVLDNSGSDRWSAFKEGLEQGAKDHNLHLNVVSTGELQSIGEECALIGREIENGAQGLIVDFGWTDPEGKLETAAASAPLVLVGNNVSSSTLYTSVAPDHFKLGKALGNAVLSEEDEDVRIGVLAGERQRYDQKQRLQGLEHALSEKGVSLEWIFYNGEISGGDTLLSLMINQPIDVLVTLSNDETERAIDFFLEYEEFSPHIYGEGRSEKTVYCLDRGMIQTLVVVNEFYMGYRSAELLAQKLGYHVSDVEQDEAEYLVVTRETLYSKKVEKVLFPTVR